MRQLLPLLFLALAGCPTSGNLGDDDDVTADDDDVTADDDDATADDDDATADDDDTVDPVLTIEGELSWDEQVEFLPDASVRVGAFWSPDFQSIAQERVSVGVAVNPNQGEAVYAVEIPELGPPDEDLIPIGPGVEAAIYFLFAYLDEDDDGGYDANELLLGSSGQLVLWFEGELPEDWGLVGAAEGWNLAEWVGLVTEEPQFDPIPFGTSASDGPAIEGGLIPRIVTGAPIHSELPLPEGTVLGGVHFDAVQGDPVPAPFVFVQPAANPDLLPSPFSTWLLNGAPLASHVDELDFGGGDDDDDDDGFDILVDGARYWAVAWFDDGDGVFSPGSCDTVVAGIDGYLIWVDARSLNLEEAYYVQRIGLRPGWSLAGQGEEGPGFYPPSLGLELLAQSLGDDDDSADDDDSGDDDDSAAPDWPGIPPECL